MMYKEEKALGITQEKITTGILLRNWVTYSLRNCIMKREQEAYHAQSKVNVHKTKIKFNQRIAFEIKKNIIRYKSENNLAFFEKRITHADVLCEKVGEGEYLFNKVFS